MKQLHPMLQSMRNLFEKRKCAFLLVGLLVVALLATGFVQSRKTVHIVADGKVIKVLTFSSDAADTLEKAGIHLGNKDEFRMSTERLVNGTTIEVFRAVPVFITYQGERTMLITGKPTVGELMNELNYQQPGFKAVPGNSTRITPGLNIRVITVKETFVEKEEVIPFPIVRQPDPKIEAGLEQVQQEGANGLKKVTYCIRTEDGQEVSTKAVAEKVLKEPVAELVRAGSRETVPTSRGSLRFSRVMAMEATAYLPSDGEGHGITFSGIPARHGVVAVDPRVIPLGARVYVPGYGVAIAADTGGDIKGNRIDLCMEDETDAWNFGRRMVKVYILAD